MSDPVVPDSSEALTCSRKRPPKRKPRTSRMNHQCSRFRSECACEFSLQICSHVFLSQAAAVRLLQTLAGFDQQVETEAQTLEEGGRAQ